MIPQEELDIWLRALRDPDAQKHCGSLEDYDNPKARCCLGHACAALGLKRADDQWIQDNYGEKTVLYGVDRGDYDETCLPKSLSKRLNISPGGGFIKKIEIEGQNENGAPILFDSLVHVNDDTDLTLAQIADLIEEQNRKKNFRKTDPLDDKFIDE